MRSTIVTTALLLACAAASAHDSNPNKLAWQACEAGKKSDACQYTTADKHRYVGTCRPINQQLMCVRNKPIEHLIEHSHDAQTDAS